MTASTKLFIGCAAGTAVACADRWFFHGALLGAAGDAGLALGALALIGVHQGGSAVAGAISGLVGSSSASSSSKAA